MYPSSRLLEIQSLEKNTEYAATFLFFEYDKLIHEIFYRQSESLCSKLDRG